MPVTSVCVCTEYRLSAAKLNLLYSTCHRLRFHMAMMVLILLLTTLERARCLILRF